MFGKKIIKKDCGDFQSFKYSPEIGMILNTQNPYEYYYNNCSALHTAIEWILNYFEPIQYQNFPNITRQMMLGFLLTGNMCFILINNKKLVYISYENVAFDDEYQKFLINGVEKFDRFGFPLDGSKGERFIHIKNYGLNPQLWQGTSFLLPILEDIHMLIRGKEYNSQLLKNGARVDGIFTVDAGMDLETEQKAKDSFKRAFTGVENAGKTLFLSGFENAKYQPLGYNSNKDMDYIKLIEKSELNIYTYWKIPIPLVLPSHATYNNYTEAQSKLYANAITPLIYLILEQLNAWLDLKDKAKVVIDIDANPIEAKFLTYMVAKDMLATGCVTINEVRQNILQLKPLIGGDIISINGKPIAYTGGDIGDENLFPKT
jgi:HK97 family phage portal protein